MHEAFISSLSSYLEAFRDCWNNVQSLRFRAYLDADPRRFLGEMKKLQTLRKRTSPRFNFFSATRIEKRELSIVSLWGGLLDPHGWHEQEGLFLTPFLECLECNANLSKGTLSSLSAMDWKVKLECNASGKDRIDMVIENTKAEILIAIEFKIRASDGDGQLSRYHSWYKAEKAKRFLLVYITPDGDLPSDVTFHNNASKQHILKKLICLSLRLDMLPIVKTIISDQVASAHLSVGVNDLLYYYMEVSND